MWNETGISDRISPMVKIEIVYEGDLHCRLKHGPSGQEIVTDAPVDNGGKGEFFSPTDLAASAMGSCMLTIMAISAQKHSIELKGTRVEVLKEMITAPVRRIGKLTVQFFMPKGIDPSKRLILERAAHSCPVHKSFNSDVEIPVSFQYPD